MTTWSGAPDDLTSNVSLRRRLTRAGAIESSSRRCGSGVRSPVEGAWKHVYQYIPRVGGCRYAVRTS